MRGSWGALRRVARLQSRERRWLALSIALAFGAVASAAALLTTSGYLISRAAQRPPILSLMAVIVAVRAFGIARAGLRYAERLASHELALRVLARLRSRFYLALAPLVPGALRGRSSGDLLSRFVADVDSLQDLYLRALGPPVVALLVIAAAALTAWLILPMAAVAVGGGLLVSAATVPAITAGLAAASARRQARARAALTSELVEAIDGAGELAVAGRAEERVRRVGAADARLSTLAQRDALAAGAASALSSMLGGATILAVLLVGIPAVDDHALAAVLLAALVFLVLGAWEATAPLPQAARRLHGCAEAAARLQAIIASTPPVLDPPITRTLPRRADGALALEHVSFRYGEGEPWLLEDFSLRLKPGGRVALTGPSGAGKTTLAHLLVRFLDPLRGRVTLDGVDLRELAQDEVRAAVLLAAQDAHIFTTTVRENLLLARRTASEAELWAALDAVALARFVRGLPAGLDTLVGEDGELLSGGERRRLALARSLVSDAAFLVLDEPTAQLDAHTAAAVIDGLLDAAGRRSVLVITHRGERLERFERVVRLAAPRLSGERAA
jgi:ATP-binding cassette subfamily C protein CydC